MTQNDGRDRKGNINLRHVKIVLQVLVINWPYMKDRSLKWSPSFYFGIVPLTEEKSTKGRRASGCMGRNQFKLGMLSFRCMRDVKWRWLMRQVDKRSENGNMCGWQNSDGGKIVQEKYVEKSTELEFFTKGQGCIRAIPLKTQTE